MEWEKHERGLPSHYVSIHDAVNLVFGFDINNEMIEFITRVSRHDTSVFETQAWLSMLCYRSAASGGRPGKVPNQTNKTNKKKRKVYDIGGWTTAVGMSLYLLLCISAKAGERR